MVAHGLVLVLEGVAQLAFGQGVDHQGEGHNQGEDLDPLGLFDKDTTDKEEGVFEREPLTADSPRSGPGLELPFNLLVSQLH